MGLTILIHHKPYKYNNIIGTSEIQRTIRLNTRKYNITLVLYYIPRMQSLFV